MNIHVDGHFHLCFLVPAQAEVFIYKHRWALPLVPLLPLVLLLPFANGLLPNFFRNNLSIVRLPSGGRTIGKRIKIFSITITLHALLYIQC